MLHMQTLLLSERCEQWGVSQLRHVGRTALMRPREGTKSRRVAFHHKRDETPAVPKRYRAVESREYRYWGINE